MVPILIIEKSPICVLGDYDKESVFVKEVLKFSFLLGISLNLSTELHHVNRFFN